MVDRTGRVDPSQPFVVSLRYGLEDTAKIEAGLAALEESLSLLAAPPPGDYDGNAFVDDEDHLVWRLTYGASVPPGSAANFSGVANFTLTQPVSGSPTLAYEILFDEVEFPEPGEMADADGIVGNEALAIHIHNTAGVDHTAGTPHSLNIFGFPLPFDDDVAVDRDNAVVTGLWEDSDGVLPVSPPANKTLTSQLDDLFAGELFLLLHTNTQTPVALTGGITLAGQIVQVPEPSAFLLAGIGLAGLVRRSR